MNKYTKKLLTSEVVKTIYLDKWIHCVHIDNNIISWKYFDIRFYSRPKGTSITRYYTIYYLNDEKVVCSYVLVKYYG